MFSPKQLTTFNLIIVGYFIMVYLINYFKIDFVLIAVIKELATIPFLIAQLIFIFLSLQFFIKNKKEKWLLLSTVLLFFSFFFTIASVLQYFFCKT